jgi:hypothetical protein
MVVLGAFLLTRSLVQGAKIGVIGFFMLIFFGVALMFVVAGQQPLMPLLSLLIYLPAIVVPKSGYSFEALRAGLGGAVMAFLAVLLALVIVFPSALIGVCRFDKCSLWGESLGASGTGNAVGMFVAAVAAITLLSSKSATTSILTIAGSFLLTDLTSSRSALIGWCIGVGVVIAYKVSRASRSAVYVRVVAVLVCGTVAVFPFLGWAGDAFTGRAYLWNYARTLFADSPVYGFGSSFWVGSGGATDLSRNYSTHNFFMEILVAGGAVGAVCLGVAMFAAARGGRVFAVSIYATATIAIVVGVSITEVVSAPGRTYLVPGLLVMVLMFAQSSPAVRVAERLDRRLRSGGRRVG